MLFCTCVHVFNLKVKSVENFFEGEIRSGLFFSYCGVLNHVQHFVKPCWAYDNCAYVGAWLNHLIIMHMKVKSVQNFL